MYSYLKTLRIQPRGCITVGPRRRVLFSSGIHPQASKRAIKSALKPLADYWTKPEGSRERAREHLIPGPKISFMKFRTQAQRLLVGAGLLDRHDF